MAAYGALIRNITTAEINRIQRQGGYPRWAYFVDIYAAKAGCVFANDNYFAAYYVKDEPDPKLYEFGLEPVRNLHIVPNPQMLVLTVGGNMFRGILFGDPLLVYEDELVDNFKYDMTVEWQQFLTSRGVRQAPAPEPKVKPQKLAFQIIIGLIVLFVLLAIYKAVLKPGH